MWAGSSLQDYCPTILFEKLTKTKIHCMYFMLYQLWIILFSTWFISAIIFDQFWEIVVGTIFNLWKTNKPFQRFMQNIYFALGNPAFKCSLQAQFHQWLIYRWPHLICKNMWRFFFKFMGIQIWWGSNYVVDFNMVTWLYVLTHESTYMDWVSGGQVKSSVSISVLAHEMFCMDWVPTTLNVGDFMCWHGDGW